MNLLQIPIIDEYWVPPQDPASHNRTTDFAISMGFGMWEFPSPGGMLKSRSRFRLRQSQRRDCHMSYSVPHLYSPLIVLYFLIISNRL